MNKKMIIKVISEFTTYPIGSITDETDLEKKLGISAKQKIQILNKLLNNISFDFKKRDKLDTDIKQIINANTVKEFRKEVEKIGNLKFEDKNLNSRYDQNNVPLNYSQYLFFLSYWSVSGLSLASRIKFKGKFEKLALTKAWNKLIEGQPSLRTSFVCNENAKTLNEVSLNIRDHTEQSVQIYDLRHLTHTNQEKIIHEFCEKILNNTFDIYSYPLCRLYAFRRADDIIEIVLASCHLVTDGLGNQQILRDLTNLYGQYLKNPMTNIDYGIQVSDYKNAIDKSLEWEPSVRNLQKKQSYHYMFPLEKNNLNLDTFGRISTQIFSISRGNMNALYDIVKNEKISLYAILVSSYLLALHEIDRSQNKITINLPTGGRTGTKFEFKNIIGCFAQNLTVTFDVNDSSKKNPLTFAKQVKDIIDEKFVNEEDMIDSFNFVRQIKNQPLIQKGKLNEAVGQMAANSLASNLYLSFVGNTNISEKQEQFNVLEYKAYTGMNKNSIDALLEIHDGCLMFSLNYDIDSFSDEFIRKLFGNVKYFLLRIRTFYETREKNSINKDNVLTNKNSFNNINSSQVLSSLQKDVSKILGLQIDVNIELEAHYGVSSIEKMKILTNIAAKYDVISKVKLFQAKTVSEMSEYVKLKNEQKDLEDSLAPAQKWMINFFDAPYEWGGYSRFRFNAKLDTDVFVKALKHVIHSTDALRMKFKICDKSVKYEVVDEVPIDIVYYSVDNRTDFEIDEEIKKLLKEEIDNFSVESFPLFKIRILVRAQDDFEFLVIGHHIILDMISNDNLFHRLWDSYWKILSDKTSFKNYFKKEKETKSFLSYIEHIHSIFNDNKKQYVEYWKQELFERQGTFLPFIQREIENLERDTNQKSYVLSTEDTSKLKKLSSSLGVSFYSILAFPMYKVISEYSGSKRVFLSHRMHGRIVGDQIYMDTVGNFAINYPLSININDNQDKYALKDLNQKFKTIPIHGASYDLCGKELLGEHYPDQKVTDIRLNFLGNREDKHYDFISVSSENDGQRFHLENQHRISEIEVFFFIAHNSLNVQIEYSSKRCNEKDINNLLTNYILKLEEMINK